MKFEQAAPGLFVARYAIPADMEPQRQAGLVAAVQQASAGRRPTGIVFVLAQGVATVDLSVPSFWLSVIADPATRPTAMAIVSPSFAVKIATKGFAVRNKLLGTPVAVEHFEAEDVATSWVRGILEESRSRAAGS